VARRRVQHDPADDPHPATIHTSRRSAPVRRFTRQPTAAAHAREPREPEQEDEVMRRLLPWGAPGALWWVAGGRVPAGPPPAQAHWGDECAALAEPSTSAANARSRTSWPGQHRPRRLVRPRPRRCASPAPAHRATAAASPSRQGTWSSRRRPSRPPARSRPTTPIATAAVPPRQINATGSRDAAGTVIEAARHRGRQRRQHQPHRVEPGDGGGQRCNCWSAHRQRRRRRVGNSAGPSLALVVAEHGDGLGKHHRGESVQNGNGTASASLSAVTFTLHGSSRTPACPEPRSPAACRAAPRDAGSITITS